jgi:Methyltransferase domain
LRFVPNVLATPEKRIWFPGCGLDLAPWLYANLGCIVLATDISPYAVQSQNELLFENPMEILEKLPNVLKEMELLSQVRFVHPTIFVHDMRTAFPFPQVDAIINVRAFHGFASDDMRQIALHYYETLSPGGFLICDTLNVQGEQRNNIENALVEAGFFVPGLQADQWYRQQLDATGILYMMVLGNPMIPHWGQYENKGGKDQEQKDREILRTFSAEYAERRKLNAAQDRANYKEGIDKIANVIYSTG